MYQIVKETEKAVAVEVYAGEKEVYNRFMDEIEYKTETKLVWLPKSQIVIENNQVADMPQWLARQNGLVTDKMAKESQEKFKNACNRYERALSFAKENGLKVRNKMKLVNILKCINDAGLVFEG